MSLEVSPDFVFGTLATDDLRLAHLRAQAAGIDHGHDLDPADPLPDEPITVRVTVGPRVVADHVTCYVTTDGADPAGDRGIATVGSALAMTRSGVSWDTLNWGYQEAWLATIPGQPDETLVRYKIQAWSDASDVSTWSSEVAGVVAGKRPSGVSDQDAAAFSFSEGLWPVRRTGSYAVRVDRERVPAWLREAVIYQVFVDRFAVGGGRPFARPATPSGIYGGTLRGILERLDHLAGLGVTCLWLSPIFPSPSHHGYDATDYQSVEPRLGSIEDLRALVQAAHGLGVRVILDLAVNHVSSGHPAFQAALRDRDAPEAGWFTFTDWPSEYLTFFGVQDHPQINADDPGAQAYMIESARLWLELGVDGFRCDYANGPSHAFWSVFRAATRSVSPQSATLGEVVDTPQLQRTYAGRLDGCLDFLLMQAIRAAFAFGTLPVSGLDSFVGRHLAFAPGEFVLPSFLDNHDMNRFLWAVRGDDRRLRLAALFQFSLPYPPIVYYGTEVGLSQERDVRSADGRGHPEEARLPMPWGDAQDATLLAYYRQLVAFRRGSPWLWHGTRETLLADDPTGVYVVAVSGQAGRSVVALHLGEGDVRVPGGLIGSSELLLTTDDSVTLDGTDLRLGRWSGAAFAA